MTSATPAFREPFGPTLRALMKTHGMTFRELEDRIRRVDRDGKGLSSSHLVNLAKGRDAPSERAIKLVAIVFGIEPERFIEARVQAVTDRLDLRRRDHEAVLAELDLIDEACRGERRRVRASLAARAGVSPDSRCAVCSYGPVEMFGMGAEVLLNPHPARDGNMVLMCANCRVAASEGWRSQPKRARDGSIPNPPPIPRDGTYNPLGAPYDLSKIPREEFLGPDDAPDNPSGGTRESSRVRDLKKAR